MNKYLLGTLVISMMLHLALFIPLYVSDTVNPTEIRVSLVTHVAPKIVKSKSDSESPAQSPLGGPGKNIAPKNVKKSFDPSLLSTLRDEIERVKFKSITAKRKSLKGEVNISFDYDTKGSITNLKIGPQGIADELIKSAKITIDRVDLDHLRSLTQEKVLSGRQIIPVEVNIIYN